jgi:hypothetical protein
MTGPVVPGGNNTAVYLFSSAPPDRPTYKRGVLNVLCYPKGHQVELSYQKSYIQTHLFERRASLANRKAIFTFIDYKALNDDHDFIPVRTVKILAVAPKEVAPRYIDTTRVYVRIELGDFIPYEATWNAEIQSIPGRPKPFMPGTTRDYCYVVEGADPFPTSCEISQRDIWDQITGRISRSRSLRSCIFLATSHPRPFKDGDPCTLQAYGLEQKAYKIEPNHIYRVDLRVFYPVIAPAEPFDREIVVRTSSDLISVSQPFATAHGGPEDHSVLIACKRTIESTLATLVIDVEAKDVTDVLAAKPRYLLAVEPPKWTVRWFVFLIFLGFFLTSTSEEFYSSWSWAARPEAWALFSKIAGAACLAWAGYLAFRKLPSGGSS